MKKWLLLAINLLCFTILVGLCLIAFQHVYFAYEYCTSEMIMISDNFNQWYSSEIIMISDNFNPWGGFIMEFKYLQKHKLPLLNGYYDKYGFPKILSLNLQQMGNSSYEDIRNARLDSHVGDLDYGEPDKKMVEASKRKLFDENYWLHVFPNGYPGVYSATKEQYETRRKGLSEAYTRPIFNKVLEAARNAAQLNNNDYMLGVLSDANLDKGTKISYIKTPLENVTRTTYQELENPLEQILSIHTPNKEENFNADKHEWWHAAEWEALRKSGQLNGAQSNPFENNQLKQYEVNAMASAFKSYVANHYVYDSNGNMRYKPDNNFMHEPVIINSPEIFDKAFDYFITKDPSYLNGQSTGVEAYFMPTKKNRIDLKNQYNKNIIERMRKIIPMIVKHYRVPNNIKSNYFV